MHAGGSAPRFRETQGGNICRGETKHRKCLPRKKKYGYRVSHGEVRQFLHQLQSRRLIPQDGQSTHPMFFFVILEPRVE